MKKQNNKWLSLAIIGFGSAVVLGFPYLQYTFYDSMMAMLGFTNTQMGNIISVYGSLNLIAYLIGGIIADRFSSRKLLTFSLVVTGLTGFWFAAAPSYPIMIVIHIIWSGTTIFTYWPASIKAVKMLGSSEEQGRFLGLREAMSCLGAFVLSAMGLLVFNRMGENFQAVIIFYSIMYLVVGVLTYIFLPDTGVEKEEKTKLFEGIGYVLKQPTIWVISFVIFFGYGIGIALGKLAPYLTAVYGVSDSMAALLGNISEYGVACIGPVLGGIVSDKMHSSSRCMKYCFTVIGILMAGVILLSGNYSLMIVVVAFILISKMVQVAIRGIYYVPLDEAGIPDKYVGTAVGVASVIGFLPEAILGTVYGNFMDRFPGEAGFLYIFGTVIAFGIIGIICTTLLSRMLKKRSNA